MTRNLLRHVIAKAIVYGVTSQTTSGLVGLLDDGEKQDEVHVCVARHDERCANMRK